MNFWILIAHFDFFSLVLRDKTTSVNNARNTFETELKRQLATFEKDLHELKSQHNTEMQTMECNYTRQIREQHEKHQEIIAQYEARDEAWQNEKEVMFHRQKDNNPI